MRGFEDAFRLFNGLRFANQVSRENALWLALWIRRANDHFVHPAHFRPPIVVITGSPGTGKTTLVRNALKDVFAASNEQVQTIDGLRGARWLAATLNRIAVNERRVVVFENMFIGRRMSKAAENQLCSFVSHQKWEGRKCSQHDSGLAQFEEVTTDLRCLLIITGNNVVLPPDLECRSVFIELLPMKEEKR